MRDLRSTCSKNLLNVKTTLTNVVTSEKLRNQFTVFNLSQLHETE